MISHVLLRPLVVERHPQTSMQRTVRMWVRHGIGQQANVIASQALSGALTHSGATPLIKVLQSSFKYTMYDPLVTSLGTMSTTSASH